MTIKEFRTQHPEEVAQVEAEARASVDHTEAVNSAVQAERDRLAGIDEVASLFDPQLVHEAKYGEHPCSAAELALKAAQAAAKAGSKFLADAQADSAASGTSEVAPAPEKEEETAEPTTPDEKMAAARASVRSYFHKKEEK